MGDSSVRLDRVEGPYVAMTAGRSGPVRVQERGASRSVGVPQFAQTGRVPKALHNAQIDARLSRHGEKVIELPGIEVGRW